jgi:hypothetical protein
VRCGVLQIFEEKKELKIAEGGTTVNDECETTLITGVLISP